MAVSNVSRIKSLNVIMSSLSFYHCSSRPWLDHFSPNSCSTSAHRHILSPEAHHSAKGPSNGGSQAPSVYANHGVRVGWGSKRKCKRKNAESS
ncbi:hypothetical protein CEXT_772451 [Caerostris extrusa]|uniref:Uncharacterized protein n=1 Tax=Caerostris extrusa TaxID=172846 RepID=A0AAV4NZ54_CAEEX|nr:hypothetical protein CEXT_772451 [Caerostris extrusa]